METFGFFTMYFLFLFTSVSMSLAGFVLFSLIRNMIQDSKMGLTLRQSLVASIFRALAFLFPGTAEQVRNITSAHTSGFPRDILDRTRFPNSSDTTKNLSLASDTTPPKLSDYEIALAEFEENTNTKVLFINHKDSSGILGLTANTGVNMREARRIVDFLRDANGSDISIILDTPGGDVSAAEVICNALVNYTGRIDIYVPFYAASAGTIIALTGNRLFLGENAFLGPYDPQFGYWSAKNVLNAIPVDTEFFGVFRYIRNGCNAALKRIAEMNRYIGRRAGISDPSGVITDEFVTNRYFHDQPMFYRDIAFLNGLDNADPSGNKHFLERNVPQRVYNIHKLYNDRDSPSRGGTFPYNLF